MLNPEKSSYHVTFYGTIFMNMSLSLWYMFLINWVIYPYKHAVNVADMILYYRLLKLKKVNVTISFDTKRN